MASDITKVLSELSPSECNNIYETHINRKNSIGSDVSEKELDEEVYNRDKPRLNWSESYIKQLERENIIRNAMQNGTESQSHQINALKSPAEIHKPLQKKRKARSRSRNKHLPKQDAESSNKQESNKRTQQLSPTAFPSTSNLPIDAAREIQNRSNKSKTQNPQPLPLRFENSKYYNIPDSNINPRASGNTIGTQPLSPSALPSTSHLPFDTDWEIQSRSRRSNKSNRNVNHRASGNTIGTHPLSPSALSSTSNLPIATIRDIQNRTNESTGLPVARTQSRRKSSTQTQNPLPVPQVLSSRNQSDYSRMTSPRSSQSNSSSPSDIISNEPDCCCIIL